MAFYLPTRNSNFKPDMPVPPDGKQKAYVIPIPENSPRIVNRSGGAGLASPYNALYGKPGRSSRAPKPAKVLGHIAPSQNRKERSCTPVQIPPSSVSGSTQASVTSLVTGIANVPLYLNKLSNLINSPRKEIKKNLFGPSGHASAGSTPCADKPKRIASMKTAENEPAYQQERNNIVDVDEVKSHSKAAKPAKVSQPVALPKEAQTGSFFASKAGSAKSSSMPSTAAFMHSPHFESNNTQSATNTPTTAHSKVIQVESDDESDEIDQIFHKKTNNVVVNSPPAKKPVRQGSGKSPIRRLDMPVHHIFSDSKHSNPKNGDVIKLFIDADEKYVHLLRRGHPISLLRPDNVTDVYVHIYEDQRLILFLGNFKVDQSQHKEIVLVCRESDRSSRFTELMLEFFEVDSMTYKLLIQGQLVRALHEPARKNTRRGNTAESAWVWPDTQRQLRGCCANPSPPRVQAEKRRVYLPYLDYSSTHTQAPFPYL